MMARRTFLDLCAAALATLGLSACDDKAPAVELVAGEDLYYVSYSRGGGISGGSESIELTRDDKGNALLTWSSVAAYGEREKTGKSRLDASAFDELERIALDYDLRSASEMPDSEFIALDADTTRVTFANVDEDGGMDVDGMFTVDSNQDLTDAQREGFRAAIDALKSLRG